MCTSVKVENESKHNPPASAAENFISSCDFPKGLRVLLVDDDDASAEEIKSKLEGMEYTVSKFSTDADALANAMNGTDTFHVAIVEVNARNCKDRFRFLEMVRDLPTIMVSDVYCLNIMMKSIALGAVEFLQKPISDDKLRNIWQHVVHKAFRAEDNTLSRSLRPIKETISTMLRLPSETRSPDEGSQSRSDENDRFPAPSTPQLDQGGRLSKEEHNHGQNNCSSEQLEERQEVMVPGQSTPGSSEPKLVDIACDDEIEEVNHQETQTPLSSPEGEAAEDEHENSSTPNKDEMVVMKESVTSGSDFEYNGELECSPNYFTKKRSSPGHSSFSHNIRTSKKKMKVDWTPELHKRFVQAVQQLGVEQAIPSKILELMKVEGLTRHNVASHLQKYRLHQRHVLPKDKEQKWLHHRDYRASLIAKKPVPAFPPYQSNFGLSPTQAYPAWGHPSPYPMSSQMWGYHGYPTWQPSHGTWPWKSCYRMYADAWGCPVAPSQEPPQPPKKEEVIDEVVKEAISKPWLPLPLGLKPPSVDSVLTELRRQGIRHIPSHFSSGCRP